MCVILLQTSINLSPPVDNLLCDFRAPSQASPQILVRLGKMTWNLTKTDQMTATPTFRTSQTSTKIHKDFRDPTTEAKDRQTSLVEEEEEDRGTFAAEEVALQTYKEVVHKTTKENRITRAVRGGRTTITKDSTARRTATSTVMMGAGRIRIGPGKGVKEGPSTATGAAGECSPTRGGEALTTWVVVDEAWVRKATVARKT